MNFPTAAPRCVALLAAAVLAGTLSACASPNAAGELVSSTGFGPKLAARPDFVTQSRPDSLEYMTIGTANPGRPEKPRTLAEVKAAEAELDAIRDRNLAAGTAAATLGGTAPPPAVTPPAAKTR
ncbi:hypothetical protein [Microvirga antarctica]|uniref:hypothetical protein n=1 Tax=Microvirga antarctica TaxID=2819233 RepID=UPI001B314B9E|nr:hypothetical protein [Microvirga antarctica]